VPTSLFLHAVLADTDLAAMLPSRLVRGSGALRVVEAPMEVPGFYPCSGTSTATATPPTNAS
jgi:hypothetical protein